MYSRRVPIGGTPAATIRQNPMLWTSLHGSIQGVPPSTGPNDDHQAYPMPAIAHPDEPDQRCGTVQNIIQNNR